MGSLRLLDELPQLQLQGEGRMLQGILTDGMTIAHQGELTDRIAHLPAAAHRPGRGRGVAVAALTAAGRAQPEEQEAAALATPEAPDQIAPGRRLPDRVHKPLGKAMIALARLT